MFARLILAVLLAAFSLPAMTHGSCADMPAMAAITTMPAASLPTPARDHHATPPHSCIGCIPPGSLASRAPAVRVSDTALPRRIVTATLPPARGSIPALPPPRRAG